MNPLRAFEEFLREGVVKKQSPNIARSRSLIEEATGRRVFLKEIVSKIAVSDANANFFVEAVYDILMEMIRAKMSLDGYHASGAYSHEAEIAYLRNLGCDEAEIRFTNELRFFRNGINYYGKRMDAAYATKVLAFLDAFYPKLKKINS